jgi:hypothetical protein
MDMAGDDLQARCAAQIGDLHRTIADWLTGRRSTVVFERDPTAPHGLWSRHLHETWVTRGR